MPSPASGVVSEILVQEGETVEVGTVLARIGGEAAAAAPPPEPPRAEPEPDAGAAAEPRRRAPSPPQPPAAAGAAGRRRPENGTAFVSPVVARIAAEHGIDPAQVPGTGRGGRVTKKDILAFVESGAARGSLRRRLRRAASGARAPAAPHRAAPPPPGAAQPRQPPARWPGESLEPMTAMRRGIAEHMRRSLDTSAHVTSAIEVDMSKVVAIREKLKKEYQAAYGVNPTYLAFIARATVETLRDYPWVNGEIRGEQIVTQSFVNLGFAVALDDGKGLIVPVVKNAETLNLLGMARGDRRPRRARARQEADARRRRRAARSRSRTPAATARSTARR